MASHETEKRSVRSRILHAASSLFLTHGYQSSSLKMIAQAANTNTGSLNWEFKAKEDILCELVSYVFDKQFSTSAEHLSGVTDDKILFFAFKAALQLHMAEANENIREMYNVSYSLPSSARVIYHKMTGELEEIFKENLPGLKTKDFYEREIASAGIMRNLITVPCDMYFEMDRKIRIFLEATLLVYKVPTEKINEAIRFVEGFDMKTIAKETLAALKDYFDARIDKDDTTER